MNIFLHATPNYVRHAVETIYSIRINSRKNLNVYLLIDMPDVSTVQNLIDDMRLENTDIHCVSNTGFNARNGIKYENDGWPSIIFSKFYIFEILPPDIDKLLLIDCDAFVLKPDIDCFYDEDISQYYAHACHDVPILFFDNELLSMLGRRAYFNIGCVVFNIKKIRQDGLEDKIYKALSGEDVLGFSRYINKYPEQTFFNRLFEGNVKWADPKYNVQSIILCNVFYDKFISVCGYKSEADLLNACVVFHNTGKAKPWDETSFKNFQPWQYHMRKWHGDWYAKLVNYLKERYPTYIKMIF